MTFAERVRELKSTVSDFIVDQAGLDIDGEEKLDAAARKVADWLDAQIKLGQWVPAPFGAILELMDGPILREIGKWLVQIVYNDLKDQDKV